MKTEDISPRDKFLDLLGHYDRDAELGLYGVLNYVIEDFMRKRQFFGMPMIPIVFLTEEYAIGSGIIPLNNFDTVASNHLLCYEAFKVAKNFHH